MSSYFGFKPWVPTNHGPVSTPTPSSPVLPTCTCRPLRPASPLPSPDLAHPPSLKFRPKQRSRSPCEVHGTAVAYLDKGPAPEVVKLHLRPPPASSFLTDRDHHHERKDGTSSPTMLGPPTPTLNGWLDGNKEKALPFPPRGSSRAALWGLSTGCDPAPPSSPRQLDASSPSSDEEAKSTITNTTTTTDDEGDEERGDGLLVGSPAGLGAYVSHPEVSRWSSDTLLSSIASASRRASRVTSSSLLSSGDDDDQGPVGQEEEVAFDDEGNEEAWAAAEQAWMTTKAVEESNGEAWGRHEAGRGEDEDEVEELVGGDSRPGSRIPSSVWGGIEDVADQEEEEVDTATIQTARTRQV